MKKLILHIVLLSYTVVMVKPALPYVSDLIGHLFFYTQHMATVHVEDGKMHIHKEIVDNAQKAASQKEIPAAKKENTTTDHISLYKNDEQQYTVVVISYFVSVQNTLPNNYLSRNYPPPKA